MKILIVIGTRPEAIKMAMVIKNLQADKHHEVVVCASGQHKEMLQQAIDIFNIQVDHYLDLEGERESLEGLTSQLLIKISKLIKKVNPNMVLVHGDTTTAFSASLAAFYNKVQVGHVEAGLRTGNLYSPWPEEANRKLISCLAQLHFAPTLSASEHLISEGINPECICITGNTVIDSLMYISKKLDNDNKLNEKLEDKYGYLNKTKKIILVTGHRRESFGSGFQEICYALQELAKRDDVQILYPVHMNPNVKNIVTKLLSNVQNIKLIEPVDYLDFIFLMKKSYLILTDSGGIQEEAPSLGKPVLIMRQTSERQEAIHAGIARLVGAKRDNIVKEVLSFIEDNELYKKIIKIKNPFGDGKSSKRLVNIINSKKINKGD